ncbi:MAG: hypothetical protein KZQ64_01440 [gamma proteobacterium symbiont of Bathyaustriella thionipta]|nr:hypothetical protein [gamma proteobacterium symbiont of Bathyaustriella thionipta]MCU7950763.1 hypothetical protein [gamma proteobacterium symbiont of Bathyaustriella thionipta]MCU7952059.1 hypothetical protein [gamma proteobacterium symbiont of Bathyaustriella thionipta]MCU7957267.1 hypothetical protein [gamma proteobacterium symbiont of Bathyaustriella thionipta]MCU7966231.1 hypothetical protein [gamma proteobacterium symbiont of Bathyaustriella thionipta]
MSPEILPDKNTLPANIQLEVYEHGGHLGFISGHLLKPQYWLEHRIIQYFKTFNLMIRDNTMTNETRETLQQEWHTLQNNCAHSETLALIIKLVAIIICLIGFIDHHSSLLIALLLLILWLQEAIWKTFQSRTEQRLLAIEKAWADSDNGSALCFYSNWTKSRPGIKRLIADYLLSAVRPTVAYPYIVLLPVSLAA